MIPKTTFLFLFSARRPLAVFALRPGPLGSPYPKIIGVGEVGTGGIPQRREKNSPGDAEHPSGA